MAGNFLAKAIGLGALGVATYETFDIGYSTGLRNTKHQYASHLADTFVHHNYAETQSATGEKAKSWWRKQLMDSPILEKCLWVKNTVTGIGHEFCNNLGMFGLGLLALFTGSKGKGLFPRLGRIPGLGKLAAGLIVFQGGLYAAKEVFGIGKRKQFH